MESYRRVVMILAVLVATSGSLQAHPHVWFETQIVVQPAEDSYRLGFEWTFDAMFTEMIVADFDENDDRDFDSREVEAIQAEAFSNLRHYDYFVTVRVGDQSFVPQGVESFSAFLRGDRLVYRFFITDTLPGAFAVTVFDDSYYCAIDYNDDVVVLEGLSAARLSVRRQSAEDRVARYQTSHGVAGIFGGNNTAVGEEIVIRIN